LQLNGFDIHDTDGSFSRHIGLTRAARHVMLEDIGADSLEALIDTAVPADIRARRALDVPPARSEADVAAALRTLAAKNRPYVQMIGLGATSPKPPASPSKVSPNGSSTTASTHPRCHSRSTAR
jgi:glycine cleavage system pyridoxal-binding protein P